MQPPLILNKVKSKITKEAKKVEKLIDRKIRYVHYQAADFKKNNRDGFITSGATDLGVVQNKGKLKITKSVSLNNIADAYSITEDGSTVCIGAKASLASVEQACLKSFPEFSHLLHIFASPQIKNKATLVGNVANASPIGDSIPFLLVVDAVVVLIGPDGEREVNINDFYLGYKKLDMKEDEFIKGIKVPLLKKGEKIKLYKTSNRKDMDISIVTFATKFRIENNIVENITIAVGGVGPVVMRVNKTESELRGKTFEKSVFEKAALTLKSEVTPIDDVRGSANFRKILSKNLLMKFYAEEEFGISRGIK